MLGRSANSICSKTYGHFKDQKHTTGMSTQHKNGAFLATCWQLHACMRSNALYLLVKSSRLHHDTSIESLCNEIMIQSCVLLKRHWRCPRLQTCRETCIITSFLTSTWLKADESSSSPVQAHCHAAGFRMIMQHTVASAVANGARMPECTRTIEQFLLQAHRRGPPGAAVLVEA